MSKLTTLEIPGVSRRLEVDDTDLLGVPRDDLVRMLGLLYLVREFETAVLDLKDANLINGPAHTSIGQEAIAAAMAVTLQKQDMVGSTHRAHGHFLSKAVTYYAPDGYQPLRDPMTEPMQVAVNKTLAEIMGLYEGWCRGRGGSMHLYDGESGNLGSNAIVGGGIPLATGAAWAEKLRGRNSVVVSFFGDGAMNQGCLHEVANMASLWDIPVLYFVENNFYAVGTSTAESSCIADLALRSAGYAIDSLIVDGMDPVAVYLAFQQATERMRRHPYPFFIEAKTYRHYHHAGRIRGSAFGYRSKEEEEEWLRRDPVETLPRKLLAHNLLTEAENEQLLALAKDSVQQAVAFCTAEQDGKRYIPGEKWPPAESLVRDVRYDETELFQDVAFSEPEDFASFQELTYVQAIARATLRNMERDERVIVLGEEVANLNGGPYAATRGIKEVFPERLINTPISECGFTGIAGGAAAVGLRPIVEIMFPDFALVAADQIFNQIGKLRHMYGGQISFPLVLRTRIALACGYGGQHSMDPGGLFGLFSGWRIVAPSNAYDVIGLMNTAVRLNDPVLFLEHNELYGVKGQVPADNLDYYVPYGKAKRVREGTDVTVLTYLTGVRDSLQAAATLEQEGLSAEVIDLRTLDYQGMDYAAIGDSVKKTGAVVIVEQSPRSMTLGARIADEIQERFFDYLDCPIGKVSAPDVPSPVSLALERAFLPSQEQILDRIRRGARHDL